MKKSSRPVGIGDVEWEEARLLVMALLDQLREDQEALESGISGHGQELAEIKRSNKTLNDLVTELEKILSAHTFDLVEVKRVLEQARGTQISLPVALMSLSTGLDSIKSDVVLLKTYILEDQARKNRAGQTGKLDAETLKEQLIEREKGRTAVRLAVISLIGTIVVALLTLIGALVTQAGGGGP